MVDYKKLYEEEKSKSHIWMIVSIVSILIGLILLIIVGYLAMTRHPMPKCNCVISQTDLENVNTATATLADFQHKIKGLSTIHSDCLPLEVGSSIKPSQCPNDSSKPKIGGLFSKESPSKFRLGSAPKPKIGGLFSKESPSKFRLGSVPKPKASPLRKSSPRNITIKRSPKSEIPSSMPPLESATPRRVEPYYV